MLISHHPASAEYLQLGEGMLLCGFDLDKALSSRDPLDCMAEAVAMIRSASARRAAVASSALCRASSTRRAVRTGCRLPGASA